MKLNRIGYLLVVGLKSIFTHGFMSFASVTIILACLIIMGSFTLLAVNIDALITDLERQNEVLAFVDEFLTDDEAYAVERDLRALPNVRDVAFVSRETAMENFIGEHDDSPTLFDGIESSVFRHRYIVYLEDITLMQDTQRALKAVAGVADVNASLEFAEGFVMVRNIVSAVSVVLIVILLVVSVFIMANTIKLASFSRREEIAIMKIVGASNAFIRFPFVVEGLVLGLLGGALAFFLQWGIYDFVSTRVMASLAGELLRVVAFSDIMFPLLLVYLGVGFFVGTFGSNVAIRNYLKV